jgi:hypothetical protein
MVYLSVFGTLGVILNFCVARSAEQSFFRIMRVRKFIKSDMIVICSLASGGRQVVRDLLVAFPLICLRKLHCEV